MPGSTHNEYIRPVKPGDLTTSRGRRAAWDWREALARSPFHRVGTAASRKSIWHTAPSTVTAPWGWDLSLLGVTRKAFKGIPRYREGSANIEDQDVFILSGAEDSRSRLGFSGQSYPISATDRRSVHIN